MQCTNKFQSDCINSEFSVDVWHHQQSFTFCSSTQNPSCTDLHHSPVYAQEDLAWSTADDYSRSNVTKQFPRTALFCCLIVSFTEGLSWLEETVQPTVSLWQIKGQHSHRHCPFNMYLLWLNILHCQEFDDCEVTNFVYIRHTVPAASWNDKCEKNK